MSQNGWIFFFFTIIIVVILWFQRFVDSIILSKNEGVIWKKDKPVIEFHRERVLFCLVISQTVLACQHEIFELIHETSP